jgi:hypothetical protein
MLLQARQVSSVNGSPPPPGVHFAARRFEEATLPRKASDAHRLEEARRRRHGDRPLRVVPPPASFSGAKLGSVVRQPASDAELRETLPGTGTEATFLDRVTAFLIMTSVVIAIGVVPVAFGAVMRAVIGSPAVSGFNPELDFTVYHP